MSLLWNTDTKFVYHDIQKKSILKCIQTGQMEKIVVQAAGSYDNLTWFEIRLIPIMKEDQIFSIMFIATDITERKRAEEELEESEEKLKKLNKDLEQKIEKRTRKLKESEEKFRTITENSLMGTIITQDNGQEIVIHQDNIYELIELLKKHGEE